MKQAYFAVTLKIRANLRDFLWTRGEQPGDHQRQDEEWSSSCRVTGVSSLNLACAPFGCAGLF